MSGEYFIGKTGFVWWQGVVEDVNDPLLLGRCRVRVLGFHNADTRMIPTESLPWAVVMQPTTSAALSEIGQSPSGLLPGSWVIGFFRDPDYMQQPVIMGSIPGIPLQQGVNIGDGFKDPSEKYPLKTHLGEPDLSRLARNKNTQKTIVALKRKTNVKGITASFGLTSWSEPKTPYDAKYPKNHVRQTESGHIQEFDDTTGKERIHTYHRAGTFQEIHPDGSSVNKIVGNNYEIILKNNRILIRGRKYENIDKDYMMKIGGGLNIEVDGDATFVINGNSKIQTDGDHYHKIKGTCKIISEGNMTLLAPRIDINPLGTAAKDYPGVLKDMKPLEPLDLDKVPEYGSPAANLLSIASSLNPSNPLDLANLSNAANLLSKASALTSLNPSVLSNAASSLGSLNPTDLLGAANALNPSSILGAASGLGSLDPSALLSSASGLGQLNPGSILGAASSLNSLNPSSLLSSVSSLSPSSLMSVFKPNIVGSIQKLSDEGSALVLGNNFSIL